MTVRRIFDWIVPLLAVITVALGVAHAQTPAVPQQVLLTADQVTVDAEGRLIAEGNVRVEAMGRTLNAARLIYDQTTERLQVTGPIRLIEDATTVVLADAADLGADLRDGLITGIRVILDQRLQIAAAQAQRQQGRFTDLRAAVATSCEVCRPGQPPLWQVQARRVIHDEVRQRVYFQQARFMILNVPVVYLPALSIPEPGVRRASGFLVPSSRTSDLVGTGVKVPLFFVLDDHADLTLTPYASTDLAGNYTRTLEMRYRQAVTTGDFSLQGAFSRDSLIENAHRGYVFGAGAFDLPQDVKLRFGLQTVTDNAYLSDYDYSSADRLESGFALARVKDSSRATGDLTAFRSLRQDEDNDEIPVLIGNLRFDQRLSPPIVGGFLDMTLIGNGHQRPSNEDIVGRDATHARGRLRWSKTQTAGFGLRFATEARVTGDIKQIRQDSQFETYQADLTPGASVTGSLPMIKHGGDGVSYLLEPLAQLVWTSAYDIDAPNDDSTQPGLDAGNLLSFERFPGLDRVEDGARANFAARWQRQSKDGLSVGVTFGRIVRLEGLTSLDTTTELAGSKSDWVAQVDLDANDNLAVRSLSLINENFNIVLNETRVIYASDKLDLSTGYFWQIADLDPGEPSDLSEISLESAYRLNDSWSAELGLRRDMISERTVRTNVGLTYRNECVKVDLSGTRRFRNTEDAEPTFTYGLTVSLAGFGSNNGRQRQAGHCAG